MFKDDNDKPKNQPKAPKNLDPLSIDELENYIEDLKAEITRVEAEIDKKKAHKDAASSIFKT